MMAYFYHNMNKWMINSFIYSSDASEHALLLPVCIYQSRHIQITVEGGGDHKATPCKIHEGSPPGNPSDLLLTRYILSLHLTITWTPKMFAKRAKQQVASFLSVVIHENALDLYEKKIIPRIKTTKLQKRTMTMKDALCMEDHVGSWKIYDFM